MTIWRMRIVCWIPKATNTHKYTLRLCNTHCFSTAAVVARTRLHVTLQYTACLLVLTGGHSVCSCTNKRLTRLQFGALRYRALINIQDAIMPWVELISTMKCQPAVSLSTVTTTGAWRQLDARRRQCGDAATPSRPSHCHGTDWANPAPAIFTKCK
jgi:hypothetical protein